MAGLPGPLHALHAKLGARFTTFAGFDMPVMYTSIQEEHKAVREAAGLFDVSHMSNLRIEGPGAVDLVSRATVSKADKVKEGSGTYTVIPDEKGNIIDDTIYYRYNGANFYMVPNAGMNVRITDWLRAQAKHVQEKVNILDESRETAIFALQGPKAPEILAKVTEAVPATPRYGTHFRDIHGARVWIAATGYTGETGYEFFLNNKDAPKVFQAVLDAGKPLGILPAGLGARDTLRLEMGYCLAGHEFAGGRTPLEAGLGWTVKWDHEFVGKDMLVAQKESARFERLAAIRLTERGIPREGYPVLDEDGKALGKVTSGTLSPTLNQGIALAYLPPTAAEPGTSVQVEIRGKGYAAEVVKPPFVQRP